MAIDLVDYEAKSKKAIRTFWRNRKRASQNQAKSGKADQGERTGVTAGKNMDGFIDLAMSIVRANGLDHADIYRNRSAVTLPGYFRPTKQWDLLVTNKGRLIAALEFKSQVGPSFGNNFNSRAEEAVGAAHDFWAAYREGAFGEHPRPFMGWLMLLEDAEESRSLVQITSPRFTIFPEFEDTSYAERYNILCRKLVQEQLYTAAAILISPRSAARSGEYSELAELINLKTFVSELAGHIASEAARA